MIIHKNNVLERNNNKAIVWDAYYNAEKEPKPLVIFCHGYKGFKDWGAWELMAEEFAKHNFVFVKFNFSHNGGTIDQPIDFPDLEAFAENNYTKELQDLDAILNHLLSNNNGLKTKIDSQKVILIGHSRGGGIAIIKASEDKRVKKLITLASVCDFGVRTSTTGDLVKWKKDGVKYVLNGRTKQLMPHNYQFYLDYKANEERFNIQKAARKIDVPFLIIHGTKDTSISFADAENLHSWNMNSILCPIKNTNHVFDASHPWNFNSLPKSLLEAVNASIKFLKVVS
jgi:pimeloyl-ACP methyl ester carboxylesterase